MGPESRRRAERRGSAARPIQCRGHELSGPSVLVPSPGSDNPWRGWGEFLQVQGSGLAIGAVPNVPFVLGTNNTQRVRITAAGVQVFGTFANSSSREYKEDIEALTADEALEGLKGWSR